MTKSPNEELIPRKAAALYFATGIAAVLMGYSIYSHLKQVQAENSSSKKKLNRTGLKLEDSVHLKSLAYLTQSNNVVIQSSAVKIILERAMSDAYLPNIVAACKEDQSIELRSKALPSLQLLTRKENNRVALLNAGALEVMVDALKCTDPDMKEVTQRHVAVGICDLIQGSDINKYKILQLNILDPIKRILTSNQVRNNELKYWTLMILYQISLSDPLPKVLIESGFVKILAQMARITYGNTNMPKFCMQSLVRMTANIEVSESKKVLNELLGYDIVDLISICLRGDDVELIYWASGLMHEYVLKDVATDQFRNIKGVHGILAGLLSAEEMYISRVILRTIKFMAHEHDRFKQEMVRSGMVTKIMHCLSLDDGDVRYWATLCIYAVAGQVESHEDIICAPEFEILLELASSTKVKVALYVSDILSLICCISSNSGFMDPHINHIVPVLNSLLLEEDVNIQYNASGAIFNVMTMSATFAGKIRDTCFKTLISMCLNANHERVQLTCVKGILMMVIKNRFLASQVNSQVTEPLIEITRSISRLILPIMMAQSLTRVSASKESPGSYVQYTPDSSELFDRSQDPLTPEYIDVTEQGTISNASRLETLLKDRDSNQPKSSSSKKQNQSLTSKDTHFLFDTSMSNKERYSLFMKFDLPVGVRDKLVGALTALNILLENDKLIGTVITGEPFKSSYADIRINDNHHERKGILYNHMGKMPKDDVRVNSVSINSSSLDLGTQNMTAVASENTRTLPESIQEFVKSLVYLVLYPTLETWASRHYKGYPLDTLNEEKSMYIYEDLIQWICLFSRVSLDDDDDDDDYMSDSQEVMDEDVDLSSTDEDYSCSDDDMPMVSVHARPLRNYEEAESSTSAKRNTDDGSESDGDTQVYRAYPNPRKIESAAERLGETRRKGERFDLDDLPTMQKNNSYTSKYYTGFSNRALILLSSLTRYESIRQYLIHELHFIEIMIYLFEDYSSLTDRVMTCLGGLFSNDPNSVIPEGSFQALSILLWRGMRLPFLNKKPFVFYSRLVLTYCSRYITRQYYNTSLANEMINNTSFVEIDLLSRSRYCLINYENCLEVRNDSWTFETVRSTHAVPPLPEESEASLNEDESHKYAYEVILESNGLMQVGWVTDDFDFDPEGGKGVGDDAQSYGYDGNRAKKWHGRYTNMRTSYGLVWKEGDVVTCAIDLDAGEIRYYKNGKDMGVAFYGVAVKLAWYPAISLATGQQCKFQFGGAIDPLKYLPPGYTPVAALATQSPINVELPPPHFTKTGESSKTNNTEEIDLSDATVEPVQQPDNPQGNVEPNLKPVDGGFVPPNVLRETDSDDSFGIVNPSEQDQKNILPSLYYEVTLGFLRKENESPILDFHSSESLITFGMQSLVPESSIQFEYNRLEKSCSFMVGNRRTKPFDLEVHDGDTVGMLYVKQQHLAGITLNGTIQAMILIGKDVKTKPYIPFVLGSMKSEINYGEKHYLWKNADSLASKQHFSNYLYRLLGNKTTYHF